MGRLRDCGRVPILPGGNVRVRATGLGDDRVAGYAGVATCGSVWSCPVCSAQILFHRQQELDEGIRGWVAGGGSLVMVTLTMRHRKGQALSKLWDALSVGWDRVVKGRPYRRLRESLGMAGYVRVVETTHGRNGWHVHVHAGLFIPGEVGPDMLSAIGSAMFSPWRAAMVAQGFDAPTRSAGIDVKLWHTGGDGVLSSYFTKGTWDHAAGARAAALELTRGDLKEARAGNRTPFEVLAGFRDTGDADDLDLWHEWEAASLGRRQMTWSRGLRDLLAIGDEVSDEEVAAEEVGTAADDLVEMDAAAYSFLTRHDGLLALVLDLAEEDDTGTALLRWADARGVTMRRVPIPTLTG